MSMQNGSGACLGTPGWGRPPGDSPVSLRWSQGPWRHTRYQESLLEGPVLAQFALRDLRKGCSLREERPGEGGPKLGGGALVHRVDAASGGIMEDIQEGHTGEEVSTGPVLPRGDAGPRYWAGRSGHRGGKMARDRAGSGAERLCGSDSQRRLHPGRQARGALQARQACLSRQGDETAPQGPPWRHWPLAHSLNQRFLPLLCARAGWDTGTGRSQT